MTLEQSLSEAQQDIRDFDFADGLSVTARVAADHLALTGEGGGQRFEYRASAGDLQSHGSAWFIRRALRSLNDRFVAGHLALPDLPDHEFLRPPDAYPAGV